MPNKACRFRGEICLIYIRAARFNGQQSDRQSWRPMEMSKACE